MINIAIIDYRVGNIASLRNALLNIGTQSFLCNKADEIKNASHLVLPGVGSFQEGINTLKESGLNEAIREFCNTGKPVLGICLGMQLLAEYGEEYGVNEGLGVVSGRVSRLNVDEKFFRLPHIGWNDVVFRDKAMAKGFDQKTDFYFVHSFGFDDPHAPHVAGVCDYGAPIVAAIEQDNIWGVQFHPEKSQAAGLQILKNFIELC